MFSAIRCIAQGHSAGLNATGKTAGAIHSQPDRRGFGRETSTVAAIRRRQFPPSAIIDAETRRSGSSCNLTNQERGQLLDMLLWAADLLGQPGLRVP